MTDWRIKDYQIRCFNLQGKLTPYEVSEMKLRQQAKTIRKERNCDELTAWQILKHKLEAELKQKKATQ